MVDKEDTTGAVQNIVEDFTNYHITGNIGSNQGCLEKVSFNML